MLAVLGLGRWRVTWGYGESTSRKETFGKLCVVGEKDVEPQLHPVFGGGNARRPNRHVTFIYVYRPVTHTDAGPRGIDGLLESLMTVS